MGKRMDRMKSGAKKFMHAYDTEVSGLIDDSADLVKEMSKS